MRLAECLPLGEGVVSGGGLLVSSLVSGILVSVSVSGGVVLTEDPEEGQQESAEDEDEQAEDDGVLDGGGVEGQRGRAVGGHGDVAQTGLTLGIEELFFGVSAGQEGDGGDGDDPLHGDCCFF